MRPRKRAFHFQRLGNGYEASPINAARATIAGSGQRICGLGARPVRFNARYPLRRASTANGTCSKCSLQCCCLRSVAPVIETATMTCSAGADCHRARGGQIAENPCGGRLQTATIARGDRQVRLLQLPVASYPQSCPSLAPRHSDISGNA